jgi:hypothetical protein
MKLYVALAGSAGPLGDRGSGSEGGKDDVDASRLVEMFHADGLIFYAIFISAVQPRLHSI